MKRRIFSFGWTVLLTVLSGLSLPSTLWAHGVGYRVLESTDRAVVVECYYSDGKPMSYAETLVFGPKDSDIEYQNGRTDRHGRFAFFPDINGTWRIETGDGMGHKVEGTAEVRAAEAGKKEAVSVAKGGTAEKPPVTLGAFLGVSLIFNLCCAILLMRRKQ
ncbi:hypothetical protein DENIS_2362 [Desulfonema ishimotonii]|uniref:DUF4198 domain-containing protein n=1 Tax=Desulfonema ishimotonii TaxID=45657 RepID=A0A401FWM0_9BACT|nr:hypothetical protein [Desulfonema ishimotonii]GBC61402.1 hypothetical protein DENIS_2362 [Desulfonema ishimotonii]